MERETYDLFKGVAAADAFAVEHALANGADVNASDELGRNILNYAALGSALNTFEKVVQPRLSEKRIQILRLVLDAPGLSLYSLNAPLPWADGVTLLGLLAWLNMPSEIMCLLESAQGLLEVDAMDDHGATPLMYAARDGNIQVVRRLLAHGARPDIRDISRQSAIQYALPHPEILWLCEEALRRSRICEDAELASFPRQRRKHRPTTPFPGIENDRIHEDLFFSDVMAFPSPAVSTFDEVELRRLFEVLLTAVRKEDVDLLQKTLEKARLCNVQQSRSPSSAALCGTPLLVNFRDSAGLALFHHALSHRQSLNTAVVDALYHAGADVGLHSCLGFTPLHHLARTAKEVDAHKEMPVYKRPLYVFTMHLIRDLRAPLASTDNNGETPLHAAAEHGRSISILQAMLDSDKAYFGKASVRETRNARDLRPVDVARPEFLSVFVGENLARFDIPTAPPEISPLSPGTGSSTSERARSMMRKSKSFRNETSNGRIIHNKTSMSSLVSSSSSESSSTHSHRSHSRYQKASLSRKITISTHSLPTPDMTPSSSFSSSFTPPIHNPRKETFDVQTCTINMLNDLSFCSSALQAYRHPTSDQKAFDIDVLYDTLFQCRHSVSQILEHWGTKLDKLQEDFQRGRGHILKVNMLQKPILNDIQAVYSQLNRLVKLPGTPDEDTGRSTILNPAQRNLAYTVEQSRMGTGSSGKTIQPHDFAQSDISTPTQTTQEPAASPSEVDVKASQGRRGLTVATGGNTPDDSRRSRIKFPDVDPAKEERVNRRKQSLLSEVQTGLRNAPKILQRAEADTRRLSELLEYVQEDLKRSEGAIQVVQNLADEAITVREKQLNHFRYVYYGRSARLSPIEERSSDGHSMEAMMSPSLGYHEGPIEEPHALRRILTIELEELIGGVAHDLQKIQVWSRVIREVLRGTRRRIRFPISRT